MVKLIWVILDPGEKPTFPHETSRERFAYFMLIIYSMIAITILLNLTVTLMNSTIQRFQDRQQLYWKCETTSVWIEFFDCPTKLFLPMPFSVILVFWTLLGWPLFKCWEFCCTNQTKTDSKKSDHLSPTQLEARRKHAKLMQEVIMRFIKKNKAIQKQDKKSQQHISKQRLEEGTKN